MPKPIPADALDDLDLTLLGHLQRHARASHVELSRVALLDRERLGFGILAWISVSRNKDANEGMAEFERALRRFPEVLECYAVTGDLDYLLKVVTTDLKEFSGFMRERLLRVPGVLTVRSAMCLEEIKHSTALPLKADGRG